MPEIPKKRPLWVYVMGVIVVWVVILVGAWLWDSARFNTFAIFCGGFFIGMLAMYIAVHLYKWR